MRWTLSVMAIVVVAVFWLLTSEETLPEAPPKAKSADKTNEITADAQIATQVIAAEVARANRDAQYNGVEYQLSEATLLLFDNLIAEAEQKSLSLLTEKLEIWMQQAELNPASQAMLQDVFTRYIEYKKALSEVKSAGHDAYMSSAHMADILESMENLRYEWFSEQEITALFSAKQAQDDSALARLRIREDDSLSETDKNRLIAESIAQLPESEQVAFQPSLQIRKAQQLKAQTQGLNKEQRLARLSAEFGAEAGQRLNNVFAQQDAWKNRVQDFRSQLNSIRDDGQLSQQEREEQISSLKSSLFSERELKRLDVFLRNPELLTN